MVLKVMVLQAMPRSWIQLARDSRWLQRRLGLFYALPMPFLCAWGDIEQGSTQAIPPPLSQKQVYLLDSRRQTGLGFLNSNPFSSCLISLLACLLEVSRKHLPNTSPKPGSWFDGANYEHSQLVAFVVVDTHHLFLWFRLWFPPTIIPKPEIPNPEKVSHGMLSEGRLARRAKIARPSSPCRWPQPAQVQLEAPEWTIGKNMAMDHNPVPPQ